MLLAHAVVDDEPAPLLQSVDPSGLAVERQTLYVADGGAILAVADRRQTTLATIDTNRIGGIAVTPEGTVYATRLGHGRAGGVFEVANGNVRALPRLAPERWRSGIAYDADAELLYTTEFTKTINGPCNGSIVEIDVTDGHASTIADGFVKPTGVVRLGDWMLVTDPHQRSVFRVKMRWGRAISTSLLAGGGDRPDAICVASPDSVFVSYFDEATRTGTVREIWLDGRVRQVTRGDFEARSIATDGARIYVAARRAVLMFDR